MTLVIAGLDVGSNSVFSCILTQYPTDLKTFVRTYKPVIYTPKKEDIDTLASSADIFALEPTGNYHTVWRDNLEARGKTVLMVSGLRVRNFARLNQLINKSDRIDAACLAAYTYWALDQEIPDAFIPPAQTNIRALYLTTRSLIRARVSLSNRIRSRLASEVPEASGKKSGDRPWGDQKAQVIWRKIAAANFPTETGSGISSTTQKLADLVCQLETLEADIENLIEIELSSIPELSRYEPVFDLWEIPRKTQTALVSAFHPLEQFLNPNLSRIIENIPSNNRRGFTKRDRSLSRFKRVLGAGKVLIQSGQKEAFVSSGCKKVRNSIYTYLKSAVAIRRQPNRYRLFKLEGKPDGWDEWSLSQQKTWLEEHSFAAVLHPYIRYSSERGKMYEVEPWKDGDLIHEVQEYNGASYRVAQLQLFYQYAPQCQGLPLKRRIHKVIPMFFRLLFSDLIQVVKSESTL